MCKTDVNDFDAIFKIIEAKLQDYDTEAIAAQLKEKKAHFASTLNDTQKKEFTEMGKLVDRYFSLIENDAFNNGALQALIAEAEQEKST